MGLEFNVYQEQACRTADKSLAEKAILISCMGLSGEAGEVIDYLKKVYGHGHAYEHTKLIDELGDVLWYIADIARKHGIDLETVAKNNILKLVKRYPDGFDKNKSINREEKYE